MKYPKPLSRRDLLKASGLSILGGAAATLFGCSPATLSSTDTTSGGSTDGTTDGTGTGSTLCGVIPSETAGPYPAHDDSAINVLRLNGVVRSDIRSSLNTGGYTGTAIATGVPLTLKLKLTKASTNCSSLAGYAIYLWHCDVNGKYSMYSSGITNQTYLRGVQETDSNGLVTFQTIYPGCYDGRMTHIHFEVYPRLAQAVDDSYVSKTSQLSFPTDTSSAVYNNVAAYSSSKTNFARTSFPTDNVFSDGITYQIATVESGSYSAGFVASLQIGI